MLGSFQFNDFIIKNIEYKAKPLTKEETIEDGLSFAYNLANDENEYKLSILTKIISRQGNHVLDINIEVRGVFTFEPDSEISCEEKKEIIKENGSAIIYPYIRSLIYNLTSADTQNTPIILPTINFHSVINDIDKDEEIKCDE